MNKINFIVQSVSLLILFQVAVYGWEPPIGIPRPEFGIEETYRMYDDPANRNSALSYNQNAEGGYYTHYIDNTHPNATDSNNPYGTASKPRLTIPITNLIAKSYGELSLPAGSVVEIHGGPYVPDPDNVNIIAQGTPSQPVFFRGPDNQNKPNIQQALYVKNSKYVIIENLYVVCKGLGFGSVKEPVGKTAYPVDHAVLRNSEFDGLGIEGTGSLIGIAGSDASPAHDIVIYNNHIHHQGNSTLFSGGDKVAIAVGSYVNNLWVVDNHIHHIQGDSFQPGHGGTDIHHLYIGRNEMHDDKENAIDLKACADVIISQNTMYGYYPAANSHGDALRVNDEGLQDNIWILFNHIYDSTYGVNSYGADAPPYIIGNIIHDCERGLSGGTSAVINNLVYNVGTGISSGSNIINNIIHNASNYHLIKGNNVHHNVLWQDGGPVVVDRVTYTDCIESDPLFVDPKNNDFHLQPTSPAIDNGTSSAVVQQVFDRFEELYGIDIRKDIEGGVRPYGAEWDIGAYEWGSTPVDPGPDPDPDPDPEPDPDPPIEPEDIPTKTELKCYNNVFNPTKGEEAIIHVELDKQTQVTVVIYDNKGKKIKTVVDEEKSPGFYTSTWNGKDDSGDSVGSGIYIVHMETGGYTETRKIAVVK